MSVRSTSAKSNIKVGLVQMSTSDNVQANLAKAIARITVAAKKGAQIVCLQELFRSRYFCQSENHKKFALAESIPGPTTDALCALAEKLGIVVLASLFERRTAGIYHNTAVVIDADGALVGKYRKMHIPDDPLYYEKFYFTPGDLGFPCFATKFAKIAVLVCWDQWFPEGARLAALAGAQILFYPTAIGWIPNEPRAVALNQRNAWEIIQRSHAIANGLFVASVNRVGREGKIKFWGHSFIAGPLGEMVSRVGGEGEEIILATCDLARIEDTRQSWPFLRDRRIDAYGNLQLRAISETAK